MDQARLYALVNQLRAALPQARENTNAIRIVDQMTADMRVIEEPFVYRAVFSGLTAGATATFQINIQADSDFKILAGTYHANVANAAQTASSFTYPLVDVLLTDQGSGRQFMDNPVSLPALFGNGQLPFLWPVPKLMAARSTLQVQAQNYDAAATYNLRLYFVGVKLFPL